MHQFLINNRGELLARCKQKVALRPQRGATEAQLASGVPLFLDQLTRTLEAEEAGKTGESIRISGAAGGDTQALSEIGTGATVHGRELLDLGYSVDQVVHDYGDLCQAITDLAFERDAPFAVEDFRTLNRCLDNAIADAVTAFSRQRDVSLAHTRDTEANQRMAFLIHELRNALGTATLAFSALELGNVPVGGATGAVLKRSLSALTSLVNRSLDEVRVGVNAQQQAFSVADFMTDASNAAQLDATARGCTLVLHPVDGALHVHANRGLLLAALSNLVQNAFKFTHPHSEVELKAYGSAAQVLIDVSDHCGGLPTGAADRMFKPFNRRGGDQSGLGLGLSIAKQSIEADGGTLAVRDVPGTGCVFTISLPRLSRQ